jgi:hypothetical protein
MDKKSPVFVTLEGKEAAFKDSLFDFQITIPGYAGTLFINSGS